MPGRIRFGVYELDRDSMELRKHGVAVRLQEQPFRVLAMLVERPGEIITRDQLQEQIWGDTFVDFDQSLNKAVNRVREALNDNAGTPQYVETVPRRGYRFIASVSAIPQTEALDPIASVIRDPVELPAQFRFHRSRPQIVGIAALATAIVLATVGIISVTWLRQPAKPTLPEARHITSSSWAPALSRDGKLLAYVSTIRGGTPRIWLQQTAGGEAIAVTSGSSPETTPDFSPDGTRIAFYSESKGGGIYTASTLPGEPKLVVETQKVEDLRFSPSGDTILYLQDQSAFTVPVDGGQPVSLALNQDFRLLRSPLWAPDGNEILFYGVRTREQGKPADWWIVPLTGGHPRQVHLPGVEQNYVQAFAVRAWVRTAGNREWIIYSTANPETWNLWRIEISPRDEIDKKPELLASGNGRLGPGGSASEDGKLAYNIFAANVSIYQIAIGAPGQKLVPTFQLPLPDGGVHISPSMSRDGRWMAYGTSNPGKPNSIMLRDLITGSEHLLDDKGRTRAVGGDASISPDGSRVIFSRDCKLGRFPEKFHMPMPCGFMVAADGGEPELVCERCTARGFSSNGSVVLLQKYDQSDPNKDRIVSLDLRTKTEQDFLSRPVNLLYNPFFSWDDQWVVFKKLHSAYLPSAQILIAPVRHGSASGEAEWIAVTDGRYSDDKPQFSADGNTVYFTSTRDGFLCVWTQRLDPMTKHPLGEPLAYEHFHTSAGRGAVLYQGLSDLSVARDKILIGLFQQRVDVWMTRMP